MSGFHWTPEDLAAFGAAEEIDRTNGIAPYEPAAEPAWFPTEASSPTAHRGSTEDHRAHRGRSPSGPTSVASMGNEGSTSVGNESLTSVGNQGSTSVGNDARAFAERFGRRGISRTEVHRWQERLEYEAELLDPVSVAVLVPERAGPALLQLARSIELLVGLRAARGGFAVTEPFTFARANPESGEVGFAEAWSGLKGEQVRHGMQALRRFSSIEDIGARCGRAILWRIVLLEPGTGADAW